MRENKTKNKFLTGFGAGALAGSAIAAIALLIFNTFF